MTKGEGRDYPTELAGLDAFCRPGPRPWGRFHPGVQILLGRVPELRAYRDAACRSFPAGKVASGVREKMPSVGSACGLFSAMAGLICIVPLSDRVSLDETAGKVNTGEGEVAPRPGRQRGRGAGMLNCVGRPWAVAAETLGDRGLWGLWFPPRQATRRGCRFTQYRA